MGDGPEQIRGKNVAAKGGGRRPGRYIDHLEVKQVLGLAQYYFAEPSA
jgi:hypothetical protein